MLLMAQRWRGLSPHFLSSLFTRLGVAQGQLAPPFFHLELSTSMVPKLDGWTVFERCARVHGILHVLTQRPCKHTKCKDKSSMVAGAWILVVSHCRKMPAELDINYC